MNATTPEDDIALGQMIGLRSLWATIRRNRRVWLATGLLGLIVGASLPVVLPHKSTAVTDLVPGPDCRRGSSGRHGRQCVPPADKRSCRASGQHQPPEYEPERIALPLLGSPVERHHHVDQIQRSGPERGRRGRPGRCSGLPYRPGKGASPPDRRARPRPAVRDRIPHDGDGQSEYADQLTLSRLIHSQRPNEQSDHQSGQSAQR